VTAPHPRHIRPLGLVLSLLLAVALPSAAATQVRMLTPDEGRVLGEYGRMESRFDRLVHDGKHRLALVVGDSLVQYVTAMARRDGGWPGIESMLASQLEQLAGVHASLGNMVAADSLYRRALALYDRPDNPTSLPDMYGIMVGAREKGLPVADSLYPVLLARAERDETTMVQLIRTSYEGAGPSRERFFELVRAGQLEAALALGDSLIRTWQQGGHDEALAEMLSAVAGIQQHRGNIAAADALYGRAIGIYQSLGDSVRATMFSQVRAYSPSSNSSPARSDSLRRALVQAAGIDSPYAVTDLLVRSGEAPSPERADSLYREAVALARRVPDTESPAVGQMKIMLGTYAAMRGDEEEFRHSGAPREMWDAMMPTRIARAQQRGDHAEADSLIRVHEGTLRTEGPKHGGELQLAYNLHDQAVQAEAQGRFAEGLRIRGRVAALLEQDRSVVLAPVEDENQPQGILSPVDFLLHSTVALNARRPNDAELTSLGLTLLLRYKGREQDLMSDVLARRVQDARGANALRLDSLAAARAALSALASRGPVGGDTIQHRAAMARAFATHYRLASAARTGNGADAPAPPAVGLAQVQAALPEDAVLVELIEYEAARRTYFEKPGASAPRYGAYVLARGGPPRFADLGAAPAIDSLVVRFHTALASQDTASAPELSRRLGDAVMRPLRPLLGSAHHLLVSPDGMLNRVPFAALAEEDGSYVVERRLVTYLTSGRDLLRLQQGPRAAAGPPLVVANPDYGRVQSDRQGADTPRGRGGDFALDLSSLSWGPLLGTSEEAATLAEIFPAARVVREDQATESLVKRTANPLILHIATHGFFLGDAPAAQDEGSPAWADATLLRAGLALAGANDRDGGDGEDGILTALEVSGLDLRRTELVVLSACETGIGQVSNGRGVYGLRRALVLAGARAQLTTLWRVNDAATRDMMAEYYERLRRGEGRGQALREVQLGMLHTKERSHPYFWAAFIPLGDWTPLPAGALGPRQPVSP
jgi:CHAT domain-containing protein